MKDRMTSKVVESDNYTQFKVTKENRGVDPAHVRKLAISMKKHGWWDGFPMVVCSASGGGYIIRDGQNRFRAAQSLKIPVKYIVDERSANVSLTELNSEHRNWKMFDYVVSHAHSGDKDFIAALDFIRETKTPVCVALSLLAKTGIAMTSLKSGNFAVVDADWARERVQELMQMKAHLDFNALALNFVRAYIKVAQIDGFNCDTFVHKVRTHPHLIPAQPNEAGFIDAMERCYNYRNQVPLPIKFEAAAIAKAGSVNSASKIKARQKKAA